jgi:hypothetical protein
MVVLRIGAEPLMPAAKIPPRNLTVISFHLRQVAPLTTVGAGDSAAAQECLQSNMLERALVIVLDSTWLLVSAAN